MRLRRASVVTACLAAVLGVVGCSSPVTGSASSASGGGASAPASAPASAESGAAEPSGSDEPGATEPKATDPGSGSGQSGSGEVALGKRKKAGYDACKLLSAQEVAVVFGASEMLETNGCLHSSYDPMKIVILQSSYFIPDANAEVGKIQVGGNSAYRMKTEQGCAVLVALTEDPQEATAALRVDVTTDGSAEPCQLALDLATKAFDRIPDA
ncbi:MULTISPECIES: hypothetical protein [Actinosynnema]|uniref:hypothetical protein n=1 Tax=Actinosynnema TaxID=40566 RepID=UPI0020A2F789|nr:hypothetical protein [Actinosynnema pretiosum]